MDEPEEIQSARDRKAQIRATVLSARNLLSADARKQRSSQIVAGIVDLAAFQRATVVMGYCTFGSELDTDSFLETAVARGKKLALPKIDHVHGCLSIYLVHDPAAQLVSGVWGIREPNPELCIPVEPAELDFILAPGVAFDERGGRIGYGKGYYDRLLQSCAASGRYPSVVGGAFDCQIVHSIPMEKHDVPMDALVTDSRSLICRKS